MVGALLLAAVVNVSSAHPRYFETADGKPWIPIGCNICYDYAPPYGGDPVDHEQVRTNMLQWISDFADEGGNCVRLWAGHRSLEVMPTTPGTYDPDASETMRQILKLAEDRNVKLKITLESFRNIMSDANASATSPQHEFFNRSAYLPYATSMSAFFASNTCRDFYLGKADYLGTTLGFADSPAVYCWELWNEINATGAWNSQWSQNMLATLKERFPKQLTVNNLGSFDGDYARSVYDTLAAEPGNDFLQVHRYLDPGAGLLVCKGPMDVLCADAVREMLNRRSDCPVVLAEVGAVEPNHATMSHYLTEDKDGAFIHDMIFAPFFAGAAGTGQCWWWGGTNDTDKVWWWKGYVAANNLWYHYNRFAKAIEGLDPIAEKFTPFYTETARLRIYGLKGINNSVVWCRDKLNDWEHEFVDKQAPELLEQEQLPFSNCTLKCYLPWEDRSVEVTGPQLPAFKRSIVVRFATAEGKPIESICRPASYVRSSGKEWVDTGIKPTAKTKMVCRFAVDSSAVAGHCGVSDAGNAFTWYCLPSQGKVQFWLNGWQNTEVAWSATETIHTVELQSGRQACDGVEVNGSITATQIPNGTLYLFADNQSGAKYFQTIDLYGCQIYEDDTLVRDLVPCEINGEGALYDRVTDAIFTANGGVLGFPPAEENPSSGEDTPGDEDTPGSGDTPSSGEDVYLLSTGSEYILTGLLPTSKTRIVVDYQNMDTSTSPAQSVIAGFHLNTAQFSVGGYVDAGVYKLIAFCNNNSSWPYQTFLVDDRTRLTVELRAEGAILVNGTALEVDPAKIMSVGNTFDSAAVNGGISIFAANEKGINGSGIKYLMRAKLYSCKIYEGDALVRDFVPYLDENGAAGLYDLCGTGFYGNASGSGEFTTNCKPKPPITREELKSGDYKRFKYESTIAFTNCGIEANAPLENIPVLLRLTSASPAGFSVNDCAANGIDLAFASCDDGAWLDYDIEDWNSTECVVWVRVPKLSVETKLKMYWGLKDGQSPGLDTSAATWTNSHYAAVLHMNELALDSTGGNEFNSSFSGSGEGKVGPSMRVLNPSGKIQLPSSDATPAPWAQALTSSEFTISFWLRVDEVANSGNGNWPYFVDWYNYNIDHYGFLICGAAGNTIDSGTALWQNFNITSPEITKTALGNKWPDGSTYYKNWFYYTASFARVGDQVHEEIYVDGQQILTGDYNLLNTDKNIAYVNTQNEPLVLLNSVTTTGRGMNDARMDEFRISSVACGAAEAAANYRMMTQSGFATLGPRTKATSPIMKGLAIIVK